MTAAERAVATGEATAARAMAAVGFEALREALREALGAVASSWARTSPISGWFASTKTGAPGRSLDVTTDRAAGPLAGLLIAERPFSWDESEIRPGTGAGARLCSTRPDRCCAHLEPGIRRAMISRAAGSMVVGQAVPDNRDRTVRCAGITCRGMV